MDIIGNENWLNPVLQWFHSRFPLRTQSNVTNQNNGHKKSLNVTFPSFPRDFFVVMEIESLRERSRDIATIQANSDAEFALHRIKWNTLYCFQQACAPVVNGIMENLLLDVRKKQTDEN